MAIHKPEVVILRRQEIRETSLILIAFSQTIGKIHGLVKGVRGARAAVPWYLEPLTLQSVVFYERRRSPLGLIGSCDLIDPFDFIRRDLVRTAYAGFCLDLVDAMTEVGDSHPEIFQLLVDVLKAMCQGMDPRRAARFFEAHFLRECGLLPDPEMLSLSPEGVVILRKILGGPISSIEKWNFSAEVDEQLRIRFQNCVREALNRELKSRLFLQAIGLEGSVESSGSRSVLRMTLSENKSNTHIPRPHSPAAAILG